MKTKPFIITVILVAVGFSLSCTTRNRRIGDTSIANQPDSIRTCANSSIIKVDTVNLLKGLKAKNNIDIEITDSIIAYYPHFNHIDLVIGVMPDKLEDNDVIFCCEAAYTGKCLQMFSHSNIAGDHVSSGVRYYGYPCERNTGAFVWFNEHWKFLWTYYSHELDVAARHQGMGFGQEMMIHEGDILPTVRPNCNGPNIFRALCEVNGKLCVIDCKIPMLFGSFKRLCQLYGAREALYLDMGSGWNHSWYRDVDGEVVEIHPKTHDYCTNWLTFYR